MRYMSLNRFISLLACINMVLVSLEFLVLSRRSWSVLCWGSQLSAGFTEMLQHSLSFWKVHSHLQLPFHLARWWRWAWTGQQIVSSRFAFRMESFRKGRGPVYSFGLKIWIESVVVRCGMRSFPTTNCAHDHGWSWYGRWVGWLWWRGLKFLSCWVGFRCTTVIAARMLSGFGVRLRSFRLNGTIGCCTPKPYWNVGSLESSSRMKISGLVIQLSKLLASLLCGSPKTASDVEYSENFFVLGVARSRVLPRRIHRSPLNPLRYWRPSWNFNFKKWKKTLISQQLIETIDFRKWSVLREMIIDFSSSGNSCDVPAFLLGVDELRKYGMELELMRCEQMWKMESFNLKNTWVSFLNVSLKMHADVIAGRLKIK